jgi:hypothetical protein
MYYCTMCCCLYQGGPTNKDRRERACFTLEQSDVKSERRRLPKTVRRYFDVKKNFSAHSVAKSVKSRRKVGEKSAKSRRKVGEKSAKKDSTIFETVRRRRCRGWMWTVVVWTCKFFPDTKKAASSQKHTFNCCCKVPRRPRPAGGQN